MKRKLITVVGAFVLFLVGCSSEDSPNESAGEDRVQFTSGVTPEKQGNAQGAEKQQGNRYVEWDLDEHIGIYTLSPGTYTIVQGEENLKYRSMLADVTTFFEPAGSKVIYYPTNVNTKVDFLAYHPFNASVVNWIYPVDVSNQTPQDAVDLLRSHATNNGKGYDKTNRYVNFDFEHQLVKIVINVPQGQNAIPGVNQVYLQGMNTTANYDLKAARGFNNLGNIKPILAHTQTQGVQYEAIVLPVSRLNSSHSITFKSSLNDRNTLDLSTIVKSLDSGSVYYIDLSGTGGGGTTASITIEKWIVGKPLSGTAQ